MAPLEDWPKLETALAIEDILGVNGSGKIEAEICYFLSSLASDPAILAQAIRRHWPIENSLHRALDVTLREDGCGIAINPITRDRPTKASLRGKKASLRNKREKAAWNDGCMQQLLKINFMR